MNEPCPATPAICMAKTQSIKQLYELALAEGEGVGTAYEYYAKRLRLIPWLAQGVQPKTMLVAGLPQKYGSSLDFLLLGAEMGCRITVVDDRQEALVKLSQALEQLQRAAYSPQLKPLLVQTGDITRLPELTGQFDLVVSSEVLQRLDPQRRGIYINRLLEVAPSAALFTPNADNSAHVGLSGLAGLHLEEFRELAGRNSRTGELQLESRTGYVDMPPFPPGITRTETQREEATTGTMEAFAMWGLAIYARTEKFLPQALRRKKAHIVFGLYRLRQR